MPFPCGYTTVQSNEIDELSCPLNVELAFPKGKGGSCESRLALDGGCGTTFHAKSWNKTEYIAIIHQDTGNYKLTLAEAERKIYLKTYGFDKSDAWKDVLLPVVNVNIYIFYIVFRYTRPKFHVSTQYSLLMIWNKHNWVSKY